MVLEQQTGNEAPSSQTPVWPRWLDPIIRGLAIIAGVILVGLVVLTFADVLMRYLFSAPIAGRQDIIEMGMIAVLSLAAPYAWRIGDHITVDVVPDLPWRGARALRVVLVRLIVVFLLGLLSVTAYQRIEEAELFNEATNIILIPHQPFLWLMAIAFAVHLMAVLGEWVVRRT